MQATKSDIEFVISLLVILAVSTSASHCMILEYQKFTKNQIIQKIEKLEARDGSAK